MWRNKLKHLEKDSNYHFDSVATAIAKCDGTVNEHSVRLSSVIELKGEIKDYK